MIAPQAPNFSNTELKDYNRESLFMLNISD